MSSEFIRGDDFICHLSNLFALDDYLSFDNLTLWPSKIRSVICNNLGYGNGIFYPQFSYYVTIIINFFMKRLGFSIIASVKVFEFLIMFFSGICMYKFIDITFKNKESALASSIMYITMPYFCEDIFDRMAYSEMAIFLFIPIVLLSITYLLNKDYKKFMLCFIIGYCGMICSHLVLTIFLTILIVLVLLINIKEIFNKKSILYLILSSVLVLGITSPFLVPMLEHKLQGNYVVFNGYISSISNLNAKRMSLDDIFYKTGETYTYLNIAVIVFAGIVIFNLKKIIKDKIQRKIVYSLYIFSFVAIIIGSTFINWNYVPEFLHSIQIPWRMSAFIAAGVSAIAGIGMKYINSQNKKIALIIIAIICLTEARFVIHEHTLKSTSELLSYYTYSTISSVETHGTMGYSNEYLPVNAKRNIDYLQERNQDVLFTQGEGNVETLENNTPYMKFYISSESEKVVLELPRIYYLGYTIEVEREDGTKEKMEYYENENGLIEFEFHGSGTITVEYTGTTLNQISNIICIISIIFVVVFIIKKKERKYLNEC